MRKLHPYSRATHVAICMIGIVFGCGALCSIRNADSESIRDTLGIIAQILGVLLGAVLIVVGRFIEQKSSADRLLDRAFEKYRDLMKDNAHHLLRGWEGLVQEVKQGEIALDTPPYREVLAKTASSVLASVESEQKSMIRRALRGLGYSAGEQQAIYQAAFDATQDPELFFRLLYSTFSVFGLGLWMKQLEGQEVHERLRSDRIGKALSQLTGSRKVLRGQTLALCVSMLAVTITAAALAILGISDSAASGLTFAIALLVVKGFVLSMILTLLLIENMLLYVF